MQFDLERSVEILQRTPGVLRTLLADISEEWTHRNYGEKTFSPFDVVGHLIHADRTNWIPRAKHILSDAHLESFPPFDRYAMFETSRGKSLAELLDEFAAVRDASLEELAAMNLTKALLNRRGRHPEFGEVSLSQLLATWTVHDLGHTHQIVKSMAYQYREGVGPWAGYLSILPKDR